MSSNSFEIEEILSPTNGKLYLTTEAIIVSAKGIRYKARLSVGPELLRAQMRKGEVNAHVVAIIENLGEAISESVSDSLLQPTPATSEDPHHPAQV